MGSFVVKASKDADLYLIWSTVVDSATAVGTREEIREYLWRDYRREHPQCIPQAGTGPDARMARADERGTSMVDGNWYGWDDESFIVMEDVPAYPPAGAHWEIRRGDLLEYARAMAVNDDAAAHALLRLVDENGHPVEMATP